MADEYHGHGWIELDSAGRRGQCGIGYLICCLQCVMAEPYGEDAVEKYAEIRQHRVQLLFSGRPGKILMNGDTIHRSGCARTGSVSIHLPLYWLDGGHMSFRAMMPIPGVHLLFLCARYHGKPTHIEFRYGSKMLESV